MIVRRTSRAEILDKLRAKLERKLPVFIASAARRYAAPGEAAPAPAAAAFRAERDRISEVDDPDERDARCPLCRLPTPALERGPEGLDREVLRAIEHDHPAWRPEHGRCARCAEAYEALLPTPG